jgi:Fe2+ transport system protein FeoA
MLHKTTRSKIDPKTKHPYNQKMSEASLTRVKKGIKVRIVKVVAGTITLLRLSSLGLRPGVTITKISSFAMKGPVTLRVGRATLALGHGMAEKIIVDADPKINA